MLRAEVAIDASVDARPIGGLARALLPPPPGAAAPAGIPAAAATAAGLSAAAGSGRPRPTGESWAAVLAVRRRRPACPLPPPWRCGFMPRVAAERTAAALTNRELRRPALLFLSFDPRQLRANQRPVDRDLPRSPGRLGEARLLFVPLQARRPRRRS